MAGWMDVLFSPDVLASRFFCGAAALHCTSVLRGQGGSRFRAISGLTSEREI